jgi:hypothetical protein
VKCERFIIVYNSIKEHLNENKERKKKEKKPNSMKAGIETATWLNSCALYPLSYGGADI